VTKALIDIDSELWSIARRYAGARDWTVNELVTTALENLVLPIAGRQIEEPVTVQVNNLDEPIQFEPRNVTPMTEDDIDNALLRAAKERRGDRSLTSYRPLDELARKVAPPKVHPGFGRSYPAPKPVRKTR